MHTRSLRSADLACLDLVAAGVLVRDLDGNLIAANRAAERILQGFLDPLQGPPADWFAKVGVLDEHGDPLDPANAPSEVAARVGIAITDQVLGLVEPGTDVRLWLRTSAVPLRDDAGRTCGAVLTFEDITGRKELEDHDRVAVALLDLLGNAASLAEYVEEAVALARTSTRLESLSLEVVLPNSGRTCRAGAVVDGEVRTVRIYGRGHELGVFRVAEGEAAARPWAFNQLEGLGALIRQGLVRFGSEALLGIAQEADQALASIRAFALADLPGLFDQTLELLGGVSFLGAGLGIRLALQDPATGEGSRLERCRCASRGSGAPSTEPCQGCRGVELPIRSPRGEEFGRLAVSDPSGRSRSWQELEFLQAVADTLGLAVDRRRAEERIAAAEQRYRRIVENCGEGIWKLDLAGAITFANPRVGELLGVPPERLVGESVWRFVAEEDRPEAEANFARIRTGGTERFDFRLLDAGRRVLRVRVSAVGLTGPDGTPRGYLGMLTDVTEHRRAEEMFRQAQKMEALGRLASGVAHDFNNLLSVILGTSDLVRRELPEGDPLAADLDEIRDAGRRAARLSKQLLAFGRIGPGLPEVVDPNRAVAAMEGLVRKALGENVELVLELDPDAPHVRIDPGHLEQVLLNLAVNARDAMPDGGTFAIATHGVRGRALPSVPGPGEWLELRVRDTGHGIAPDVLPRIFDPFFSTKPRGEASGLGLPTVFGIVEQAGGRIAVDSEPGHGATFTTWLPVAPADAPRPPAEPERSVVPAGHGETILIADDEEAIRGLARRVLTRNGYRVIEAENGERALSLLGADAAPVDLLLADMVMPRMSAPELIGRLPAERRPPVLLISGYGEDGGGELSAGAAAGFLAKPFTAEGLLEAVGRLLGNGRAAAANDSSSAAGQ